MIHYLVFNVFVVASFASEQKIVSPKSPENVGQIHHPPEILDPLRGANLSAAEILHFYKNVSASSLLSQLLNENPKSHAVDLIKKLIADQEAQLKVLNQVLGLVDAPQGHKLSRGLVIGTLQNLYKTFDISFDLYLNTYKDQNGGNFGTILSIFAEIGGRKLPIIISLISAPTPGILFIGQVQNKKFLLFHVPSVFPLKQWKRVQIKQVLANGKYINSIIIDHKIVHTFPETNPRPYKNLQVYASSPYGIPADGYIKNVRIISSRT